MGNFIKIVLLCLILFLTITNNLVAQESDIKPDTLIEYKFDYLVSLNYSVIKKSNLNVFLVDLYEETYFIELNNYYGDSRIIKFNKNGIAIMDGYFKSTNKFETVTILDNINDWDPQLKENIVIKTLREGAWNYYNSEGVIVKKEEYKNGELILEEILQDNF
ncbi:hypothetical protein ACFLS4_00170 [Bacteroidota bacterium]